MNKLIHNKFVTMIVMCLLTTVSAPAQSGGPYVLEWNTIDGGGGQSSSGQYAFLGTIGQPDAEYSNGGSYELLGGFLPGGPVEIINFLDYSRFSGFWQQTGCNSGNDWCDGADLDRLGSVNWTDLKIIGDQWLAEEPPGWPL